MTEEVIDGIKTAAPIVADAVSAVLQAKNTNLPTVANTPVVAPPTTVPTPVQTSSPGQSVWEKPVKLKIVGKVAAEGELGPVLIGIGALVVAGLVFLGGKAVIQKTISKKEGEKEDPKKEGPAPFTTNRDYIGKPIKSYVPLIPHLANCGDNVLLWGESKIGKTRLGFQWGIDLAQGHHSSLFPSETCLTPRHYVFYYAYELEEKAVRYRYGHYLDQYENLQVIYSGSGIGNTDFVLEDLKNRLKSVPQDSYVAVFFDTLAKIVGWGHSYDEKKAGEFLDELIKLQSEYEVSHNTVISNIIIAHQKNDKAELEAPNCVRQTVKTEMRFIMVEEYRKYLLEHLRANNIKPLDEPLHLHVEDNPFVMYVADEDVVENEQKEDVENPFKENGDYDWKKLAPFLKKLTNEGKSQKEIAETLTEKYGKETNQQSVSAAMGRLGKKPDDK